MIQQQKQLFSCATNESYLDRHSWLAARRSMIGASDTAGIFQVGYASQSPVTVWDSKVSDRQQEFDEGLQRRMRIGKLMEPTLRSIFGCETGLHVADPGEFTIFRNCETQWLGATLDGVTDHDEFGWSPVELKNVNNFNRKDWEGDEAPLKFQVQCQHQLAVTGATHGFLLGLVGGDDPVIKTIERNDRFIAAMLQRLADFWGFVERKEMPPIDESLATAQLLAQLWPQDSGAAVQLPDEAVEWDRELMEAKEAIKAAEACKTQAENKLKASIGEAAIGLLPHGGSYTWRSQDRKEYVCKATSFRVLRRSDK